MIPMLKRFLLLLILVFPTAFFAQEKAIKIAVLTATDESQMLAREFAAKLSEPRSNFKMVDLDLAAAAARGAAADTKNLFNLSLEEARILGAAIDCDYFFAIKNQTFPRSSFAKNNYFESNTIVFLVSARSGRLLAWEDKYFEADTAPQAVKMMFANLPDLTRRLGAKLLAAANQEQIERAKVKDKSAAIEDLSIEGEESFRVPLPYKSLRPEYTKAARRLNVEATVDAEATINERGEVQAVEILRWAGFDLDETTELTIRKMQFRPALRDGKAVPTRVLLRYNFREIQ